MTSGNFGFILIATILERYWKKVGKVTKFPIIFFNKSVVIHKSHSNIAILKGLTEANVNVTIYNGFGYAGFMHPNLRKEKRTGIEWSTNNFKKCDAVFFHTKSQHKLKKQAKLCKMKDSRWTGCSDGFGFLRALPLDPNGGTYSMHLTHPSSKDWITLWCSRVNQCPK